MTTQKCPVSFFIRSPPDTLHTLIVLSSDPEAKYSPFGENTTLLTEDEWPVMRSPLDTLHTPIVLDPDAKYSPFGKNTTLLKYDDEWPVILYREHIEQLSILDIYNPSFFLEF